MPNLITLSRLLLLVLVVVSAWQPPAWWQFLNVPLLILLFVTDGLDGWVARRRGETSLFGALFDIASDRIVELTLWIVLADPGLVPLWVPLLFVIRGVLVDTIRSSQAATHQASPFSMIESPLGRFIVAGRFMRVFYAVVKAHAFCWLLLLLPMPALLPGFWADWGGVLRGIGHVLVGLSVALCVLRALPVIAEFIYTERRSILGRLSRK